MVDGDEIVQAWPGTNKQVEPQQDGPAASEQTAPSQAEAWAELRGLVARARQGDRTALPRLREFLDRNPVLWERPGNLSLQAQAAWIDLTCGPNLHARECTARWLNQWKQDLADGSQPSPLEALLIERVVIASLRVNYLEAHEAQHVETSPRWAQIQMQRQALAERQLRAAVEALETYRKASRPIAVEVRQAAAVTQPVPMAASAANGNGQAGQPWSGRMNGIGQHMNGVNRLNGTMTKLNGHARPGVPAMAAADE